ncbi:DoxX family protein [Salinifilum aidingensis]
MPQPPEWIRDLALLLARIALGVVFIAHGLQKFAQWGISGTTSSFAEMGVPVPGLAAWTAALVETLGGLALIAGAALPLAGVLLACTMLGAWLTAHTGQGLFVTDGGFEYVLVLAVAALALGFNGGAYALDRLGPGRKVHPAAR